MVYHPNFPPSLSITPNVDCLTNAEALSHGRDTFGVEAQQDAISKYGIAGRVWEAAHALCAYIDPDLAYEFDPPFADDQAAPLGVIELGSGTGVVAASISRAIRRAGKPGGFVIATDLSDVCPLLQHNLGLSDPPIAMEPDSAGPSDVVHVRPLAWGNLDHASTIASELGSRPVTHVVCSDLVYFPELLGPLLRTLIHLTGLLGTPSTKIVISYKIRSLVKETPFWSAFGLWFTLQPVLVRRRMTQVSNAPLGDDPDTSWKQFGVHTDTDRTFIFVTHRRPESITWHLPETDQELLEGVGARGTRTKKGDDTFETILFMGIDDTGGQNSI